jgi:outer membrane usher protein
MFCGPSLLAMIATPALSADREQAFPASTGEQAVPFPENRKPQRTTHLDISLMLNGSSAGDVAISITGTEVAVDVPQLLARLGEGVTSELRGTILAAAGDRRFVPIAEISSDSFPLSFNPAALQLEVVVPLGARSVSDISITGRSKAGDLGSAARSPLAFGVSLTLADRLRSRGAFRDLEREPFNVAAQGFASFGQSTYLTFLGGIQEGGRPFRQRTTLFRDDEARAIRYSLGDIDPLSSGAFSNPLSLVGLGVERLYQTIQPYRNLRSAGRGGLVLERPSRVQIYVNGAVYRTIALPAGRYSLRDFPFLDGLNDVELQVQDDTGRNESISLSFFSDTELLDKGISIFSATAGFRRNTFSRFDNPSYSGKPTLSALYQAGITDRLTLGATIQADPNNLFVTGLAAIGTPVGIFGVEAAFDAQGHDPLEHAFIMSYRLVGEGRNGRHTRFDLNLERRSAGFNPLEPTLGRLNPYKFDLSTRFQTALPFDTYASVTAGYSKGRAGLEDLRTASAGLSRSFGRLSFGIGYGFRNAGVGPEHRGSLTLSLPLSARQYARASFDTDRNRLGVDYAFQGYEGLDQTTAQISLAREDQGRSANVQLEHFANRFRALVQHDYLDRNNLTVQTTDVAITTGFGYADGVFAIGRDPGRGFVIVDPHSTLRKAPVIVADQYSLGPVARSGALGPALVPIQRQYQRNSLSIAVPDAPLGYDIGSGRLDIAPGAASGYSWQIGSAASYTVVGRIVQSDGEPAAFLSGVLRPLAPPNAGEPAPPIAFFTNRTGRLAAQNLAPGRYVLVTGETNVPIAEIDIPANGENLVDVGTVVVKE